MIYAIIPARYESTRFPGKPLALISGKPMIQHVYEQTSKSRMVDKVLVATDDERILNTVQSFGGDAILTSKDHRSGTDRLAEVIKNNPQVDIAVNVQGDEPLITAEIIDQALKPMILDKDIEMTTLIREQNDDIINNPNIVKVVIDKNGYALYFSRSCIPFVRHKTDINHYVHIGLYCYRRDVLINLSETQPATIECSEGLEQLRALYEGIKIKTILTSYASIGVDIPEDLERVERYFCNL